MKIESQELHHDQWTLSTLRLCFSGALVGMALLGLFSTPYHDAIGAALGGLAVLVAKIKHVI